MRILEKLSVLPGVSSCEGVVRDAIIEEIRPYVDDIHVDAIGNLIAHKKGPEGSVRAMVTAHMDEVGLIVRGIRDDGLLAILTVGAVDPRVLVSRTVKVGEKGVPGIIGSKAIHLQSPEDRNTPPSIGMLFIDIGATDKASAEKLVQQGDVASFDSEFVYFGDGLVKGKALDNRGGCATIIEVLKQGPFPCDLYAVFTAQEEVGARGAGAVADRIHPDVCLVLECTTANDVSGVDAHRTVVCLGDGVVITPMEGSAAAHPGLLATLKGLAIRDNIRWQYKRAVAGGTDSGAIHLRMGGIPSAVIATPTRYIHSPVSVLKLADLDCMIALTAAFLRHGARIGGLEV